MAMILDTFVSKFTELLLQMAKDEGVKLLGVPDEIEKLKKTVVTIQCVLADAEKKKITDTAIELWLKELKDVMYDADDVMDLCQIKAQERIDRSNSPIEAHERIDRSDSPSHSPSSSKKGCGFLNLLCPSSSKKGCGFLNIHSCFRNPVFAHEIGNKIKEINSRLEEMAKRKGELGLDILQNAAIGQPLVQRVSTFNLKTDSKVNSKNIVGAKIKEDADILVSWLLEEEKENVSIGVIVGMGGIGKTTLAKMVFNDPRIAGEVFKLRIWACVSKKMNERELLKSIIKKAGGDHGGAYERDDLVNSLEDAIRGKRFLLVLDDVWKESETVWSELLCEPLMAGAQGSRLLVTTRDATVGMGMGAAKTHRVKKMSDEDGWSLLMKKALQNEDQSENFKNIGLQLVQKCDGLPLAIKTVGGLLCKKSKTIGAWQAVLDNAAWTMKKLPENVHQSFYLSYEDLTSPLKQCFITCSLYPEDYIYSKNNLIYLWFAEGFLKEYENMWETGNDYYNELLERNLLESNEEVYDEPECKMHDLLWSFARNLGRDENLILKEGENIPPREFHSKLRRLSVEGHEAKTEVIINEKCLRTLLIDTISNNAVDVLCRNFWKLRILDLSYSDISTLPDSLGDLKQLRYLDVSYSEIRSVPESIGNLRNLVYLNFDKCKKLSDIPPNIINLKQLRHLLLNYTVETIPVGLKNFKNLLHLYRFKPDKDNSKGFSSLDELEPLSQLKFLDLYCLERISETNIVKEAKLQRKEKLQQLTLHYTFLSRKDQLSQSEAKKESTEGVLNELFPPSSLESLRMKGYFGNCLPKWLNLGAASLPNLRYLSIKNCNCFKKLAQLGQLPYLNQLEIEGAHSVEGVGNEFFGTDNNSRTPAFPELYRLRFERLAKWKDWKWNKEVPAMPKLKELVIYNCRQLRSFPEGLSHHATSLECLQITGAHNLTSIENFPTIKEIFAFKNQNLERISNLPNVSIVSTIECPKVETMEKLNNKSLQLIQLYDRDMEVLPEYLVMLKPHKLRIGCNKGLLREITTNQEGEEEGAASEWHKFKHIAEVNINTYDESLCATYQKQTPPSFAFTTNFTEIIISSEDEDEEDGDEENGDEEDGDEENRDEEERDEEDTDEEDEDDEDEDDEDEDDEDEDEESGDDEDE